tara:strand:+ start:2776 stop:3393 length:618 start_codon:yes stop_codon:yes gene_type:complete
MKRSIIIIDDFYSRPEEVRKIALNSPYPDPGSEYTYPGKNSDDNFYPDELHKRFEQILNRKLVPAHKNGYFRLSLETDSFKQDVHVDPSWEFGAVCYLNTPDQCIDEGGTSFWIHNKTKSERCPQTDEQARECGYSQAKEVWWTTVYGEGLDRSKWTRYLLSPMKYNRIVIFRTDLWHSHNYNFGDSLENGRLVQLFFFNPTDWD